MLLITGPNAYKTIPLMNKTASLAEHALQCLTRGLFFIIFIQNKAWVFELEWGAGRTINMV